MDLAAEPPPAPAAPQAPDEADDEALEHAVEIEEGVHTLYPQALTSHEAVLGDKQLFMELLQDLLAKLQYAEPPKYRPGKFRVPTGERQQAGQVVKPAGPGGCSSQPMAT